jgi:outer membrane protein
VTIALLAANTAAERVELTRSLLAQASLALDLAQSRYDLGLSSIVELSQAQLAHTSANIQSTSAKYDYQAQRAILNFQVGR